MPFNLFPPEQNDLLPVIREVDGLEALHWKQRHELLESLEMSALPTFPKVKVVDLPQWAESLVESRGLRKELSLVFIGQQGGRRIGCFAFDLASERLLRSDNQTLLLLFLRMLEWLGPPSSAVQIARTGDVITIDAGSREEVEIHHPNGAMEVRRNLQSMEPLRAGRLPYSQ